MRLLSLLPTATCCERIWSAYDHVHSKKRNRLLNTKVEKVVAIEANLKLSLFAPPEKRGSKTSRVSSECKTRKYAVTPLYDADVSSKTSDVSDDDDDLWSSDE